MISIIIPVIRPQNIEKLLDAIKDAVTVPYEVIWEEDTERIGAPKMVKKLVDKTNFDWVVFLGDDTLPEKKAIDYIYNFAIEKNLLLVGFNDLHGERATHWIAHKSLLDHLENREFFYTGYIHNFCDDELRTKAEKLGKYGWCKDAIIYHSHPIFDSSISKETYKTQMNSDNWEHDKQLFAKRNFKISIVMIVKNEEVMLAQCLESVKEADEIIIVDTGSIDKTKEVAAQFTDKIYDFMWCDDFAQARNFALSKATGDWILSIDADEILEKDGIKKIRNVLFTNNPAVGIKMKCNTTDYHVPRVFRNIPSIKWSGRIHETVNALNYDKFDIVITYGSSPAHILDPKRNIRILEKTHEDSPHDTRIMYYLAREYAYYKNWEKAEEIFEKYLKHTTWLPEKADAHFMLALCYWYDGKGNGEKTRENCLKAICINANFKAPILLMAHASFEKNAIQWRKMAETADNSDTLFARERFDII